MKKHLLRGIKSKNGSEFMAGGLVDVEFFTSSEGVKLSDAIVIRGNNGRRCGLPHRLWKSTLGIKDPEMRSLTKWVESGIARSVFGKKVEPDGWDSERSPSWLLTLGLI